MMPRYHSFLSLVCIPLIMVAFINSIEAASLRNIEELVRQPESTTPEESRGPELDERQELVDRELDMLAVENEVLHAYMYGLESSNAFAGVMLEFDAFNEEIMNINYFVQGGPSSCKKCLVAIHRGTDCSKPRGRYFQKTDMVKKNPWTKRNGALIVTDKAGTGHGWINEMSNGYSFEKNADHVIMIYDGFRLNTKKRRRKAKPVACGVLKKVIS